MFYHDIGSFISAEAISWLISFSADRKQLYNNCNGLNYLSGKYG